jgi:hypothetical protein
VNPLLKDLLRGYQHYWVTSQSEYSTDIVFKSSSDLRKLFPRLLSHSTLFFGVKDVMGFLGRKLTGHFLGEIISDMKDGGWRRRIPGARIKHRVKENWLKMYGKDGSVLRVEMVINSPEEFKVRKKVSRKNKRVLEWVSMRKGVAYLLIVLRQPTDNERAAGCHLNVVMITVLVRYCDHIDALHWRRVVGPGIGGVDQHLEPGAGTHHKSALAKPGKSHRTWCSLSRDYNAQRKENH